MTNTCPQLPPGMADASWQKHFELLWGSDYIILRINNSFEPSRSGLSWQIPKPPWSWVNLEGGWLIFNQALNQLFYRDKKKCIYEYLDRLTETCRQKSSCFLKSHPYLHPLSASTIVEGTSESTGCLQKTVTSRYLHAWILPPLVQFEEEEDWVIAHDSVS